MRRIGFGIVFGAYFLAACAPKVTPPAPVWEGDEPPVCCESFGYGAMMVKCCESYAWTTTTECAVGANHVGGGMQIVDDSYCPAPAPVVKPAE